MATVKHPVSYSQIAAYNRCSWLWQVQWQRGIQPRLRDRRIDLGTIVHVGLAAYFKSEFWAKKSQDTPIDMPLRMAHEAIEAWADENFPGWEEGESLPFQDYPDEETFSMDETVLIFPLVAKAKVLLDNTVKYLGNDWEVLEYQGKPVVEMPFSYGAMTCVVDLAILEKSTGMMLVVDFKVRSQLQNFSLSQEFDLQTAIYQYVLSKNGLPVVGSAILQIRSVTPRIPRLNKDGKMSRSDIVTDWKTYKEALIANGLDPNDYSDMLLKLSGKKFFDFSRTYRSPQRQQALWQEVIKPAMQELSLARKRWRNGKIPAPRNMHPFNCASCRFSQLCLVELEGSDSSHLMGTSYEFRDKSLRNVNDHQGEENDFNLDPFQTDVP